MVKIIYNNQIDPSQSSSLLLANISNNCSKCSQSSIRHYSYILSTILTRPRLYNWMRSSSSVDSFSMIYVVRYSVCFIWMLSIRWSIICQRCQEIIRDDMRDYSSREEITFSMLYFLFMLLLPNNKFHNSYPSRSIPPSSKYKLAQSNAKSNAFVVLLIELFLIT